MRTTARTQEIQDRKKRMRELLLTIIAPGSTVYTIQRHTASSGLTRVFSVLIAVVDEKGKPGIRDISGNVSDALDYKWDDQRNGIQVRGSGMDMGWHLVYTLGRVLFPDGGELQYTNSIRQRQEADEGRETDGGYLLHHARL